MHSLCDACGHVREIVSGAGSRFLLCQKSQQDRRYPKYPPQPVLGCIGFEPRSNETTTLTPAHPQPKSDGLRLDQFLKLGALAQTGGQAKVLIQAGQVKVNGDVETRRRRKLVAGDVVEVNGERHRVEGSFSPQ